MPERERHHVADILKNEAFAGAVILLLASLAFAFINAFV